MIIFQCEFWGSDPPRCSCDDQQYPYGQDAAVQWRQGKPIV